MHVVSRVVGFKKIRFHTNREVGSGELDLPEQQMHTTSYWLEVPLTVMNALPYATDDRRDGVVGLAFAMKQVAQLLLMCDARDIGLSVNTGDDQPAGVPPKLRERRRSEGGYAADLPLRRIPGRHRLQRAVVGHAAGAAVSHAIVDHGLRLRHRVPGLLGTIGGTVRSQRPWRCGYWIISSA